jgi:hypothetical protein
MQGMKASQPYAYMVRPGVSDDDKAQNDRQLQSVQDTVARGVLPGNMLVFGGPGFGQDRRPDHWPRSRTPSPVRSRT